MIVKTREQDIREINAALALVGPGYPKNLHEVASYLGWSTREVDLVVNG